MIRVNDTIYLRAIEDSDIQQFRKLRNNLSSHYNFREYRYISENAQKQWYQNLAHNRNIELLSIIFTHDLAGIVGFCNIDWVHRVGEITISIFDKFRRKRVAFDAVNGFLKYGFEDMGINRVHCEVVGGNEASYNLFNKLGFTQEGVLRQRHFKNGKYNNVYILSKLKEEHHEVV